MNGKKYTGEEKIQIVQEALEGKDSISALAGKYTLHPSTLDEWIRNYQSMGTDIFVRKGCTKRTSEEKESAVLAYLNGEGSLRDICKKFHISDTKPLRQWILKYNGHEKLKASGTGESQIMTKGRKTTFEERIEIVRYCIGHEHNYAQTAEKYRISYQQARNYTVKYETGGIESLRDRRGKRRPLDEMNELERLRAENRLLKAEKERAEMELSFLKKLEEIERRRG